VRVLRSVIADRRLQVVCEGEFGLGSQGNLSGGRLKEAIEQALSQETEGVTEVVISFRNVAYEWGDGPAWAVLPAIRAGLKVRYLAAPENAPPLTNLFQACGLGDWCVVGADTTSSP
jgi:hypothetical protein